MINNPNVENNWDQVNLMIPFYDDLLDTKYSFGPTTIDGNPAIVTNRSKFSQGSVEFNGTNERLFYQHTEFTRLEENDFTIECWVRPSVLGTSGGGSSSGRRGIFSTNTSTSSALYVYFQNDLMFCTISGVGSSASAEVEAGDWIHVAVSRTGFDTMFFVDGQLIHTFENEFYNLSSNTIVIGANNFSTGNAWGYLNGNIENFRLSKGVGRYTEEFFPPVVPYPTGNTVRRAINFFPTVRLKSDFGMDDCGPNERSLEYNIQPPTITYDVPFLTGNSSFYFNDSMISTGFDEDTQIGLNDFTIEAWIYMPNTNGRHTIFANYGYSQTNTCWFGIERGRIMVLNGAGNENLRGATNRYNSRFRRLFDHTDSDYEGIIDENRWHHVAWSREVRTNRVFLDGVEVARFNNRQNWSPRTQLFGKTYMRGFRIVGSGINRRRVYSDVTRYPFIGYMNDIQFNNMVCKYKSDFTPRIESDTDKVVAKSLFDRHNVDIDNFADRIVKDITYDAPNKNNIFWFNDISGFVLQKPEDHTTGVSVTSAITDSQGVLNIRYSDGTSQSFTDVYEPIDQVSKTEGTGILYDVDGDVLKFKPLIGEIDTSSFIDVETIRLLLPFNDDFNDVSEFSHIASPVGNNLRLDHETTKFGQSSMFFPSDLSYLTYTGDGLLIGDDMFTVEFWVYLLPSSMSGRFKNIFSTSDAWDDENLVIGIDNGNLFLTNRNFSQIIYNDIRAEEWTHVAAQRTANNIIQLFVNGTLIGDTSYGTPINNQMIVLGYGRVGASTVTNWSFNGYIDDFRFTVGSSRYPDSGYTVPNSSMVEETLNDIQDASTIGTVIVEDNPNEISVSYDMDYSLGLSIDHSVTMGHSCIRGFSYNNIHGSDTLPFNFIKDNHIDGSISDGIAIIPEGRYFISGYITLQSNRNHMTLVNDNNGDEIFRTPALANQSSAVEINCYYSLRSPGAIRMQLNNYGSSSSTPTTVKHVMHSTLTFFRIG